jgi:hypothetical protein
MEKSKRRDLSISKNTNEFCDGGIYEKRSGSVVGSS